MNFSPNIDSYSEIEKQIEQTLSSLGKITDIRIDIESETDISKEISCVQSEIESRTQEAEKSVENIRESLVNLIESDFHYALNSYQKNAYVFSDNDLHSIFSDNYGDFPFDEWSGIPNLEYNVGKIKSFFTGLPKSGEDDWKIYFSNLLAAFNYVPNNKRATFFKETLDLISSVDEKERDLFITKIISANISLNNTLAILLLTDEANYQIYEKWKPVIEKSLIAQCSQEEPKQNLINFILFDEVNNDVFCQRKNNNRNYKFLSSIKIDNFKKLIDVDISLNLGLGSSLASSLMEIASKQSNNNKANEIMNMCQQVISCVLCSKLEHSLESKNYSNKQIKI